MIIPIKMDTAFSEAQLLVYAPVTIIKPRSMYGGLWRSSEILEIVSYLYSDHGFLLHILTIFPSSFPTVFV